MGITAENVAEAHGITRAACDEYALSSQQRWAAAAQAGRFAEEIAPLEIETRVQGKRTTVRFDRDEHPRPETTPETLARLKPSFKHDGVVTAGNASGISDGAAALVVASRGLRRAPQAAPPGPGGRLGLRGGRAPADGPGPRPGHRPGPGQRRPEAGGHGPGGGQRGLCRPVPGGGEAGRAYDARRPTSMGGPSPWATPWLPVEPVFSRTSSTSCGAEALDTALGRRASAVVKGLPSSSKHCYRENTKRG